MVTISDIAAKSHVSRTLVSRTLNNQPGVSPETRKRIWAVARELHYRPNALAKSLVQQRTQIIGVVMDTLCDPYFFDLISGMQDAAEKLGYNIVFSNGRCDADVKLKYLNFFSQGITDGVIAYGSYKKHQNFIKQIASTTPCFVLVEGTLPGLPINNVLVDNYKGAYGATEHLIGLGYRRISHFTGDMNYDVSLERFNGFITAMHDHSVPISSSNIVNADFYEDSGYAQMRRLIDEGDLPEAIFFGADRAAFGALRALQESRIRVPEDIAIIGFDGDTPHDCNIVYPKLTTCRQPLYEMGCESVQLLVHSILDPDAEPTVRTFEPQLVLGDTCR